MSLAMVMLDGLIAGIDMGSEIPVQKSELVGLKTVLALELENRRASPASVPEKIKKVESGFRGLFLKEAQAYKQGWNECRAAMLAAAPTPPVSEDRWQPIETAPNHEEVMVWPYPTEYCMTAQQGKIPGKRGSFGWWYWEYETGFGVVAYECKPTHWMPLPKAPAMQEDKP